MKEFGIGKYLRELFLESSRRVFFYFDLLGIVGYFFSAIFNFEWLKYLSIVIIIFSFLISNYFLYKQVSIKFGDLASSNSFIIRPYANMYPGTTIEILYIGKEVVQDIKVKLLYTDNTGKDNEYLVREFYHKDDTGTSIRPLPLSDMTTNDIFRFHTIKKANTDNGVVKVFLSGRGLLSGNQFTKVSDEIRLSY